MKQRASASKPRPAALQDIAPPRVREVLQAPGRPLDAATRGLMESRFGHDFSRVRVHADEAAGASARAIDARAYALGPHGVFAPGQYTLGSRSSQALLAHELAHGLQQGAALPDCAAPVIGSPAGREEREADAVQQAFIAGRPMPELNAAPAAIQRQPAPPPGPPPSTITDANALIRSDPPALKATSTTIPVGTRVDILETQTTPKGRFVKLREHGTATLYGWTAESNLGEVQYAEAGARFVYMAPVQHAGGHADRLPVMVYLSPTFDGQRADILVYFHGDAADYSADVANNYERENPALGMDLKNVLKGAKNQLLIAPQVNVRGGDMKSPWNTLGAGDYESIVQTVLAHLQADLGLKSPIARGSFSIAGHSGGGKALGQATQDLDASGQGVADVTLVEAGYGGGEGDGGTFSASFKLARDWLLEGRPGKVLRVITKATSAGTDTRHAIENNPDPDAKKPDDKSRVPVLALSGIRRAIKAKKLDAALQADQTDIKADTTQRSGGMALIRKIVVTRTAEPGKGQVQGTVFVFLMADPPRDKGVDTHFGVRDSTIGDLASGRGKGDGFGALP